ncbi:hypothetical protein L1887_59909 [Cichorium endivia]|nr:hypothetical protein L1887_59909 [Cichorium endivia]
MHWTADHLILWQAPVTYDSVVTAYTYYQDTMVDMPSIHRKLLLGIGTLAALLLISKALGGRESNWLFDGASLFLFGAAGLVYYHKIEPSLATLPPRAPSPGSGAVDARDAVFAPLREIATSPHRLGRRSRRRHPAAKRTVLQRKARGARAHRGDEARIRRRQRRREQEEKRKERLQAAATQQS